MEYRVKKQIKHLLLEEDLKIKDIVPMLAEKNGRKYEYNSFIHRLRRGTILYEEMLDIADILGYEIKFEKKK